MTQTESTAVHNLQRLRQNNSKRMGNSDAIQVGETEELNKLPQWLQQAQVMLPGNLVGNLFGSLSSRLPLPQGVPQEAMETTASQSTKPPESSALLTIGPLAVNGLLVSAIALMMILRLPMQKKPKGNSQEANVSEKRNIQSENSSDSLGFLVVFLMASAIYISPSLRKYVPPTVRLIGGIMIGVIFNLSLKYIV